MRSFRVVLVLAILIFASATFIFSGDSKVRIIVSKANIRLKATTQSDIVTNIPLGAVLDVVSKEGNWYFIKLPPDDKGIVITGYIHQSIVEFIEAPETRPKTEEETLDKKEVVQSQKTEKKQLEVVPNQKISTMTLSTNAEYLSWNERYKDAEIDLNKWGKHSKIGLYCFLGGSLVSLIGSATIGANEKMVIPTIIGVLVGTGGAGYWIYASSKKGSAKDQIDLLMNEGRIKGYLTANINLKDKYYAVTFSLVF